MEKTRIDYFAASDLVQSAIAETCSISPELLSPDTRIETLITRAQLRTVAENLIDKHCPEEYEGIDRATKDVATVEDLALNVMMMHNKW